MANYISASVDVIDIQSRRVVRIIDLPAGPSDILFAGNPTHAFITCPAINVVVVCAPETGEIVGRISIAGDRPKAMAATPDGTKVYVAIFESGNGTTILAPPLTPLTHFQPAGPADLPIGPYSGLNPPPNSGTNLFPAMGTNLPPSAIPPPVSLIVKRQRDGKWLDDNAGDWTEFVSGGNAALSGRVRGWDLPDRDLAVIDTTDLSVSYVSGLMNICMDVAVDPVSGAVAVVGSDGINHVRFEPVLQSIFHRVNLALIDPAKISTPSVLDLNPHLDYKHQTVPQKERDRSLSDPRCALWENGRLYVAGMGSDNLVVLDRNGSRVAEPIAIGSGPVALALDQQRRRLFVLNRFDATVAVVNTETLHLERRVSFYDPTPTRIRLGREHFYNTHKNSGLGQAACASCHLDARMDRLAWDLGTQLGKVKEITTLDFNFGSTVPQKTNHFHPMKGPMVTQTLQDIIHHEPFHWRGDRLDIEEFNPTFKDLQGRDDELTDAEMLEFKDFLASIYFPPNRLRNFDNSLPKKVALDGQKALGRGTLRKGDPLPDGDPAAGLQFFRTVGTCTSCHSLPSGHGPDRRFVSGAWRAIPLGTNGQSHISLVQVERSAQLPFKIPQLRNLPDKLGLDFSGSESRSGFGFMHDGRIDSLVRFVQDGFEITDDQQAANVIAFLLAFSGSDLTNGISNLSNKDVVPDGSSHDVPSATGKQLLFAGSSADFDRFRLRALSSTGRVELIVRGSVEGRPRSWWFSPGAQKFLGDRKSEQASTADLMALASLNGPYLAMLVPAGTGLRMALDRDDDGFSDGDEVDAGSNPANAKSYPGQIDLKITSVTFHGGILRIAWPASTGQRFRVEGTVSLEVPTWTVVGSEIIAAGAEAATELPLPALPQQFYRVRILTP